MTSFGYTTFIIATTDQRRSQILDPRTPFPPPASKQGTGGRVAREPGAEGGDSQMWKPVAWVERRK